MLSLVDGNTVNNKARSNMQLGIIILYNAPLNESQVRDDWNIETSKGPSLRKLLCTKPIVCH